MTDSLELSLLNLLSVNNLSDPLKGSGIELEVDFSSVLESISDFSLDLNFENVDLKIPNDFTETEITNSLDAYEGLSLAIDLLNSLETLDDLENIEINEISIKVLELLQDIVKEEIQSLKNIISQSKTPEINGPEIDQIINLNEQIEELETIIESIETKVTESKPEIDSGKKDPVLDFIPETKKIKIIKNQPESKIKAEIENKPILESEPEIDLEKRNLQLGSIPETKEIKIIENQPEFKIKTEIENKSILESKSEIDLDKKDLQLSSIPETKEIKIIENKLEFKIKTEIENKSILESKSEIDLERKDPRLISITEDLKLKTIEKIKTFQAAKEPQTQILKPIEIKNILNASRELEKSLEFMGKEDLKFEFKTEKLSSKGIEGKSIDSSKLDLQIQEAITKFKSSRFNLERNVSEKIVSRIDERIELLKEAKNPSVNEVSDSINLDSDIETLFKTTSINKSTVQVISPKLESISLRELNQILEAQALKQENNSSQELKFKLNPERLGTVEITISKQNNELEISMKVHSEAALQSIRKDLTELSQILKDRGIEIKDLSVSKENQTEMSDQRSQSQQNEAKEEQKKKYFNTTPHWLGESISSEDISFRSTLEGILEV
jgi:flagellar hook-length control protein FliK